MQMVFHFVSFILFVIWKTNTKGCFAEMKQEQTLPSTVNVLYRCEECPITSGAIGARANS